MRTMSEPRVSSSRRSSEKSCTIALSTCSNSSSLSSEMRESTSRFISTTSSASSLSVWSSTAVQYERKESWPRSESGFSGEPTLPSRMVIA